ncbi:hypothetical protein [Kutzneria kofuensis]|uniref:Uncharacterized protein n=1 Tax=Kutzneria kofuensis TaxID=103725 RepID=A0A7W9KDW8_9PSEU|nr:hypothetical protein [Kutzneria kofuensis]MBB5890665.1 hypothetical protein [Kutzneria kofuensis]
MARTTLTLVRIAPAAGNDGEPNPYRPAGLLTTSSGNRVVALSTRRNPTRPPYTPTGKDAA